VSLALSKSHSPFENWPLRAFPLAHSLNLAAGELREQMNSSVFTKQQINEMTGPCVYAFVGRGTVLYVGYSHEGVRRFLSAGHHVRCGADEIRAFWFPSHGSVDKRRKEALLAEAVAIHQLRPAYNKTRGKPGTSTGHNGLDEFIRERSSQGGY
jgi:hypothetical protein